jgi:hypothetical protein
MFTTIWGYYTSHYHGRLHWFAKKNISMHLPLSLMTIGKIATKAR